MGVEIDSCQNTTFHHGFPTIFLLLVFRYWTTTRQGTTENKTGWQRLQGVHYPVGFERYKRDLDTGKSASS